MMDLDNVQQLIPQRPPMVMVDTLVSSDEKQTITHFTITEDNIFCKDGRFHEAGLIENIAQSAALRSGYEAIQNAKESDNQVDIPVGFIGGIKNFTLSNPPKVGSKLKTTITVLHEFSGVSVIHGEIVCDEQLISECEMKIFLKGGS